MFTDTHDLALILVHHTNRKPDDGNPFNLISGTNGLLGAADGGFVLRAEQEKRFLHCIGRDLPIQHHEIRFDPESCRWEIISSCKSSFEPVPDPLLDWIDAIIEEQWQGTASDLLQSIKQLIPETDLKPNTLTRRLNPLTARLEQEKDIIYRCSRNSERRMLLFTRKTTE